MQACINYDSCKHCSGSGFMLCACEHHFLLVLQFDRFDPTDGRISELDFAKLVLSSTFLNNQGKKKFRKRVKEAYGTEPSPVSG